MKVAFERLRQLIQRFRAWRQRRDDVRWAQLDELRQRAESSGWRIGQVIRVRQKAQRGSKFYLRWIGASGSSAAWAERYWPSRGDVLVVRGNVGYGEHHHESVFYVNEVIQRLPASTYRSWARAERRRTRALSQTARSQP